MTEHDGLTAEQEAERRWPGRGMGRDGTHLAVKFGFVAGAEWATEREKARAEAAEARVAELEDNLRFTFNEMCESEAENERLRAGVLNFVNAWDEDMSLDSVGDSVDQYLRPALAAPTTEAVTEVEGS